MIIIISLYDMVKRVWLENHRELEASIHWSDIKRRKGLMIWYDDADDDYDDCNMMIMMIMMMTHD